VEERDAPAEGIEVLGDPIDCASAVTARLRIEDDVAERGLERTDLVPGVQSVPRARLAGLYEEYAQIWHW
jgi:hypothetical protein